MKVLDLGCGTAKESCSIGVDRVPLEGVDVVADLGKFPYPFADNTFDVLYLKDIIEHLPDTMAVMEEIYRIAKPSAKIFIRTANWNSHFTFMDPTHCKAFTENSFDFFGNYEGREYYTHARFDVVRVGRQYNISVQRFLRSKRLMKFLSRYLCNILEGLHFELSVLKDQNKIEAVSGSADNDLISNLRCRRCIGRRIRKVDHELGKLTVYKDHWLLCQERECNRKYPLYRAIPILLDSEAELWDRVNVDALPIPALVSFP